MCSSHPVCSYSSRSEPEQTELQVACRLAALQLPCIGVHVHVSLTGIPHGWHFDALLCVSSRPLLVPRVADRLVMEQLMVEVLEEVTARELLPQEAAAVMALAGGQGRFWCVAIECDWVFKRFEGPGGGGSGLLAKCGGMCCKGVAATGGSSSHGTRRSAGACWGVRLGYCGPGVVVRVPAALGKRVVWCVGRAGRLPLHTRSCVICCCITHIPSHLAGASNAIGTALAAQARWCLAQTLTEALCAHPCAGRLC